MKTWTKKITISSILVFLAVMFILNDALAQTYHAQKVSHRFSILFRINEYKIDTLFMGNDSNVKNMSDFLEKISSDEKYNLDSISVIASASQDGRLSYNISLSEKRAASTARLINDIIDGISGHLIVEIPLGEDWDSFERMVVEDTGFPSRSEALEIIRSGLKEDEKERKLKKLPGFFKYMLEKHVHKLRAVNCIFHYTIKEPAIDTLQSLRTNVPYDMPFHEVGFRGYVPESKMIFALRSNLLVPALNIGIEVPIGYNWSVGADYYFPWWLSAKNDRCIQMLSWFVDTKYWLGANRTESDKLAGHALGFYAGFGYYDFQWLKSGYQGEFVDLGIDYTYSMPVAKDKLRIAFNIGLGWIHTVRRHYTPTDGYEELIKDPGIKHQKINFFGPTRVSVSLVLPIRVKSSKGGGR